MPYYNNNNPYQYPVYPTYPQYQPVQPMQNQPVQQTAQNTQMPFANQPVQQTTQTIQNGGFVSVPNEATARNWPVAPGNSVTFMSFNQFETPQFVKYRLVREEAVEAPTSGENVEPVPMPEYALKADVDAISAVIDEVKSDIAEFRTELFGIAGKKKGKKEDTDNA